jgi:hypothetical protein
MERPRSFIAASTPRSARGPKRRTSRATMRARTEGLKTRLDSPATPAVLACQ